VLVDEGVSFLRAGAEAPSALPIRADGSTFTMAQESEWLDERHFAVGRWDGSLSVFAWNASPERGPLITTSASDPTSEGVQMITLLGAGTIVTSCGESSLGVWRARGGDWRALRFSEQAYSSSLGAANSGILVQLEHGPHLVVGHANGFISVWSVDQRSGTLTLRETIDLRSSKPVNPWGIHNIRGVQCYRNRFVVTGSEDGFISVVDLVEMKLKSQTVYNPAAQRGINSVALTPTGDLLVSNCSVGDDDSNLWYFALEGNADPLPCDNVNLKVNAAAPQVFNFCTVWGKVATGPCFFSSTEEGALWMGTVSDRKLQVVGYQQVTSPLGSALDYQPGGRLTLVSHDLYEFHTGA
jgi:WD40 repeat protein